MPSTICSTSQRCRLLKSFFYCMTLFVWGFPHSSVGKESSCNAGDLTSIPGSRRSAGKGIGYPPQYSWASLVAQLVKHLPAMRKTWVQSLGWEDPVEKGKSTHSSTLAFGQLLAMNSIEISVKKKNLGILGIVCFSQVRRAVGPWWKGQRAWPTELWGKG